ncbi:MAG: translation elongation factor Ts [Syntrophomonas sp.]
MNQHVNKQNLQYLRQETGAGIMACKNALLEAQDDLQLSMAILHKKGFKAVEKKAERTAADGIAFARVFGNQAVLVEVNTETDFVAGNSQFIAYVEMIAKAAAVHSPVDIAALMQCLTEYQDYTVGDLLQKMALTFGEKIVLRRFSILIGDMPTAYMHLKGKYGVILDLAVDSRCDENNLTGVGKELGMQIAAMAPLYVSRSRIDDETKDAINAAIIQQVKDDESLINKPPQVVDKIIAGRIEKYYRSKCLMEQDYIRNDNITVQQFLQAAGAELGMKIEVKEFYRYERAEGLHNEEMSNIELARQLASK